MAGKPSDFDVLLVDDSMGERATRALMDHPMVKSITQFILAETDRSYLIPKV